MVHREFLNLMGQQKKIKILLFDLQIYYLARQISGAVKHTLFVGTCALYVAANMGQIPILRGILHLKQTACGSIEPTHTIFKIATIQINNVFSLYKLKL